MKNKCYIISAIAFVSLLSCSAPKNVIRLQPDREPDKWLFGQAIISDSLYGVHYEVGFDRIENNRYLFDFHITNGSNLPILIDPTTFYCQPYDSAMSPLTNDKIAAINPEDEILELDKELSRNQARQKNNLGVTLAAVGIGMATAIITNTDENPHNDYLGLEIADELTDEVRISKAEDKLEAMDLNELRDTWTASTIRKTTLNSNFAMHGKVLFPAFPQATYLSIMVPVDSETLTFTFRQVQHSPRP